MGGEVIGPHWLGPGECVCTCDGCNGVDDAGNGLVGGPRHCFDGDLCIMVMEPEPVMYRRRLG